MNSKDYSGNIRRVRKNQLHMSQEEAAGELGICLSAYGKFERGKVRLFNKNLTALSRMANMSEVELLAGGHIENAGEDCLRISYGNDEKLQALKEEYEARIAEYEKALAVKEEQINKLLNLL